MLAISLSIARALSLFRLRPFDASTSEGRSKERYRRVALTSLSAAVARAIGLIASLISVPLTLSYLGAERYGLWLVLTSLIAVMSFADLGVGNGLINAVSEAYGKNDRSLAKEYVSSAFFLMLAIAAIFALVGGVGYRLVPWQRLFNVKSESIAAEGARSFLVLYCWFVVNIPLGVVTRAQSGLQRGYSSQMVGAFGNIVSLLALLVCIEFHGKLAVLVFASTFGALSAAFLNGWLLFREHPWLLPSWPAYSYKSANKLIKLGLMFFVLQCAVAVGYSSDNIVIVQILGAAAVALYAVPQKLFSFVSMLVAMGITPLWPAYAEAFAAGDSAWVRRVFLASLRLTLLITVPLCMLLAFAGPWILRVALGKVLYVPPSLLMALAVWGVVAAVSGPMAMLLNGASVLKAQTVIAVVASLSNLALSVYLTRRFGVIGACLGSVITQLLISLPLYSWVIWRLFNTMALTRTRCVNMAPSPNASPQGTP